MRGQEVEDDTQHSATLAEEQLERDRAQQADDD
jgi:hypothetical protein